MNPEAELVELGPVEPGVDLQPVWGHEAGCDEDNHDEAEAESNVPSQGPLPVGVGVGEQVISNTLSLSHDGVLTLSKLLQLHQLLFGNFHNKFLAVGAQDGVCWPGGGGWCVFVSTCTGSQGPGRGFQVTRTRSRAPTVQSNGKMLKEWS